MEGFDTEMAARVWQRVQNRESGEKPVVGVEQIPLAELLFDARELAYMYQALSRQFTGKNREQLRQMYIRQRKTVACIRGICALRGQQVKFPALTLPKEPVRRRLEKCCHRAGKSWAAYQAQAKDGEYGPVFERLARQEGEHCMVLMEILGKWK